MMYKVDVENTEYQLIPLRLGRYTTTVQRGRLLSSTFIPTIHPYILQIHVLYAGITQIRCTVSGTRPLSQPNFIELPVNLFHCF